MALASSMEPAKGPGSATPSSTTKARSTTSGTSAKAGTSPRFTPSGTRPSADPVIMRTSAIITTTSATSTSATAHQTSAATPARTMNISLTNMAKGGKPAKARQPAANSTPVTGATEMMPEIFARSRVWYFIITLPDRQNMRALVRPWATQCTSPAMMPRGPPMPKHTAMSPTFSHEL